MPRERHGQVWVTGGSVAAAESRLDFRADGVYSATFWEFADAADFAGKPAVKIVAKAVKSKCFCNFD